MVCFLRSSFFSLSASSSATLKVRGSVSEEDIDPRHIDPRQLELSIATEHQSQKCINVYFNLVSLPSSCSVSSLPVVIILRVVTKTRDKTFNRKLCHFIYVCGFCSITKILKPMIQDDIPHVDCVQVTK